MANSEPGPAGTDGSVTLAVVGLGAASFFLVRDVVVAAEHYRDALGFKHLEYYGQPACFCIVSLDKVHIMLSAMGPDVKAFPNGEQSKLAQDAYIWVDDARAHYEFCQTSGAKIIRELEDADYGCREFVVQDADGYTICIGQVLK